MSQVQYLESQDVWNPVDQWIFLCLDWESQFQISWAGLGDQKLRLFWGTLPQQDSDEKAVFDCLDFQIEQK